MNNNAYEKLKDRLVKIAELNTELAGLALEAERPMKETSLDLSLYSKELYEIATILNKKAKEMDSIVKRNKKQGRLSLLASDLTSDAATLGINLSLMEDVMKVASSDKIRALLNQSDDEDLKNGILKLERSKLEFVRDCAELGLESFDEKYPQYNI